MPAIILVDFFKVSESKHPSEHISDNKPKPLLSLFLLVNTFIEGIKFVYEECFSFSSVGFRVVPNLFKNSKLHLCQAGAWHVPVSSSIFTTNLV